MKHIFRISTALIALLTVTGIVTACGGEPAAPTVTTAVTDAPQTDEVTVPLTGKRPVLHRPISAAAPSRFSTRRTPI